MEYLELSLHILVTAMAVVGVMLRVEHRLTKIETDVKWLRTRTWSFCKGEEENEGNLAGDKA